LCGHFVQVKLSRSKPPQSKVGSDEEVGVWLRISRCNLLVTCSANQSIKYLSDWHYGDSPTLCVMLLLLLLLLQGVACSA